MNYQGQEKKGNACAFYYLRKKNIFALFLHFALAQLTVH